jgi:hypothetical protein
MMAQGEAPYIACTWGRDAVVLRLIISMDRETKVQCQRRGFVYMAWVHQQLILRHLFVGCFVIQCENGSLPEGMVNKCQLVLLPNVGDQIINARRMGGELKVEDDGLFRD